MVRDEFLIWDDDDANAELMRNKMIMNFNDEDSDRSFEARLQIAIILDCCIIHCPFTENCNEFCMFKIIDCIFCDVIDDALHASCH